MATTCHLPHPSTPCRFYPRHPRGWRLVPLRNGKKAQSVSIHATLAGGDTRTVPRLLNNMRFYPRHPRGWRLAGRHLGRHGQMFLSTPPSRVATRTAGRPRHKYESFYPRHPRGWRLTDEQYEVIIGDVSIHATLAGGDSASCALFLQCTKFLSTPPSRVATSAGYSMGLSVDKFLSTPPSRVATSKFCYTSPSQHVSIHATLAGGDERRPPGLPLQSRFYPRHPRGWRHVSKWV